MNRRWIPVAAAAAIVIGGVLRLRGLDAMEFKADEQQALDIGIRLLADHPWSSTAPFPDHGAIS